MGDTRLKILSDARMILEKGDLSQSERDSVMVLLDILSAALEKHAPSENATASLAREVINQQSLLALLKQQTDELYDDFFGKIQ